MGFFLKTLGVFAGIMLLGGIFIEMIPMGYTEAAILYLAGVTGAGLFWLGGRK